MKKKYLIFYFILLLASCDNKNYINVINWSLGTLDEVIALNANNDKLIMIDFYTNW